jgi:rare lipoprotein A
VWPWRLVGWMLLPGLVVSFTGCAARSRPAKPTETHPTYPFGTAVRVTNLKNGRSVHVRIVDRGPTRGPRGDGVIIDLSRAAAGALGFIGDGRTRVRVEVLRWGS